MLYKPYILSMNLILLGSPAFCSKFIGLVCFRLEPLLQRIKEKRSAVLVPIIDVIDDKTFEYMYSISSIDFFQVQVFP